MSRGVRAFGRGRFIRVAQFLVVAGLEAWVVLPRAALQTPDVRARHSQTSIHRLQGVRHLRVGVLHRNRRHHVHVVADHRRLGGVALVQLRQNRGGKRPALRNLLALVRSQLRHRARAFGCALVLLPQVGLVRVPQGPLEERHRHLRHDLRDESLRLGALAVHQKVPATAEHRQELFVAVGHAIRRAGAEVAAAFLRQIVDHVPVRLAHRLLRPRVEGPALVPGVHPLVVVFDAL